MHNINFTNSYSIQHGWKQQTCACCQRIDWSPSKKLTHKALGMVHLWLPTLHFTKKLERSTINIKINDVIVSIIVDIKLKKLHPMILYVFCFIILGQSHRGPSHDNFFFATLAILEIRESIYLPSGRQLTTCKGPFTHSSYNAM